MQPTSLWCAYFSATDTTRAIVTRIAGDLGQRLGLAPQIFDFTLPEARKTPKVFAPGDLVVIGTPVYAGRVPNLLLPYVSSLRGEGAIALPVVCYGNRNYDDALMELGRTLQAGGFALAAAGAFPCQHAFSQTQAAGRPDQSDLTVAGGFAASVARKIREAEGISALPDLPLPGNDPVGPYYTPRDRHGAPINILKVKPKTADTCVHCGLCARQCPLGALDRADPALCSGKCMKCNRCVKHCPVGAKYFDDPNYLYHKTELEAQYSFPRQEPTLVW
jgi:ferredoxin